MDTPDRKTIAAAVLGACAGLRTFTPVAVLSQHGRLGSDARLKRATGLVAAAELIGDKLPFVGARTEPLPYLIRISSGALCGGVADGPGGALAGAAASAVTTLVGYHVRRAAAARFPALIVAMVEDSLAVSAAQTAVTLLSD